MALVALVTNTAWLLIPLTYGFVARVAAGPKISPLGQFAVRIAAPRLTRFQKSVPGPPKRFAQAIGLAFTGAATIVWLLSLIHILVVASILFLVMTIPLTRVTDGLIARDRNRRLASS